MLARLQTDSARALLEDGSLFELFVRHIREHRFGGRSYTYFEVDGWKYWTMGAPVEETRVINCARV